MYFDISPKKQADKIDITERMTYLQIIQMLRRDGGKSLDFLGEEAKDLTEEERKALAMIDWELVTTNASQWYDRAVAAMRLKDRVAREKELDNIEKELDAAILRLGVPSKAR